MLSPDSSSPITGSTCPCIHTQPNGETIRIFARGAVAPGKEKTDLPWLAFFQGGPGLRLPVPHDLCLDESVPCRTTACASTSVAPVSARPSWLKPWRLLESLKARRTTSSISAPISSSGMPSTSAVPLLGERPWSILGQSYGGFCSLTYLSFFPGGVKRSSRVELLRQPR